MGATCAADGLECTSAGAALAVDEWAAVVAPGGLSGGIDAGLWAALARASPASAGGLAVEEQVRRALDPLAKPTVFASSLAPPASPSLEDECNARFLVVVADALLAGAATARGDLSPAHDASIMDKTPTSNAPSLFEMCARLSHAAQPRAAQLCAFLLRRALVYLEAQRQLPCEDASLRWLAPILRDHCILALAGSALMLPHFSSFLSVVRCGACAELPSALVAPTRHAACWSLAVLRRSAAQ